MVGYPGDPGLSAGGTFMDEEPDSLSGCFPSS